MRPAGLVPKEGFIGRLHYSGTLGMAHDLGTITSALDRLGNDPRFRFVFAGGGARRQELENYCTNRGVTNVAFHPYCSRGALSSSLAEGHVGLVTQLPQTCGSIVPSKTYGIMAAGRPILYIGPADATPARIVDRFQCGWRIDPGDVNSLVSLLEHLEANRQAVHDAGKRGRAAFEQYYDLPVGVRRIADILGLTCRTDLQAFQSNTYVLPDLPRSNGIRAFAVPDAAYQERLR